ncbi:MAG: MMPL family transporter, partial [Alphaproteobacteria bacterium]|nr:MMPL family transporter [Alphaproteobacteria bacterium]
SFRQNHLSLQRAFPAFKETIVAVIDGDSPEESEAAAKALATAMAADSRHFSKVKLPGSDPFFEQHGLLYLDIDALSALSDRLAAAQPLLAALAADPNLKGISDFIRLALEQREGPEIPEPLDRLFQKLAEVTDAARERRPKSLSWQEQLDQGPSRGGKRRLLIAEPEIDYGSLAPAAAAITATRETAQALGINLEGGAGMRLTGSAVIEHEELDTVRSGALWAGLAATAGVAFLLVFGLGSIRLIVATLATLLVGLIITAGLATLMIGQLNLISVTFAVLFVGLGVDFGIHLCLRYREEAQRRWSHVDALGRAIHAVARPLSLTAICAGLGFTAFVPTDYQGLAELGIISATGMAVAWMASLVLLPALLNLMPIKTDDRASKAPVAVAAWTERYASSILGLTVIAAVSSVPMLPRVTFDFNPLNLKDPTSESVATFLELERNPDTATNVISVLAADLEDGEEIAERLRATKGIGEVITLKSFVPKDQAEKLDLIDGMAFFLGSLTPSADAALDQDARESAFQQLVSALAEAAPEKASGARWLLDSLTSFAAETDGPAGPALLDLEQRLTRHLPNLLTRLEHALDAREVSLESLPQSLRDDWINGAGEVKVMARPAIGIHDNRALQRFADAALAVAPDATGTPVIITQAGRVVVGAFIEASVIAFSLITVVLILILRRLIDVVLVLAPLALAILFTAATSVFLGLQLNFANVIVLPLLLGLGVSGAIHVVMRRRAMQARETPSAPISTPRAVLFSALTTIASFGSLAISPHPGMASMGVLLTVAILWSLVCTLVILPAMFALIEPPRGAAS